MRDRRRFMRLSEEANRTGNRIKGGLGGGAASAVVSYHIVAQKCRGCGRCKKACKFGAISGANKKVHAIDLSKCLHCNSCVEECRHGAIQPL